jgi:hypothetical protein
LTGAATSENENGPSSSGPPAAHSGEQVIPEEKEIAVLIRKGKFESPVRFLVWGPHVLTAEMQFNSPKVMKILRVRWQAKRKGEPMKTLDELPMLKDGLEPTPPPYLFQMAILLPGIPMDNDFGDGRLERARAIKTRCEADALRGP